MNEQIARTPKQIGAASVAIAELGILTNKRLARGRTFARQRSQAWRRVSQARNCVRYSTC